MIRNLTLGLVATMGTLTATAQEGSSYYSNFRTWSVGVNAGYTTPSVLIGGQNDFSKADMNLGYGMYIKKQLSPMFSLRVDGVAGKVGGNNSEAFKSGRASSTSGMYNSFTTNFVSGTISGQANLLNLNLFKKENSAQLYANAGIGIASYQTELTPKSGAVVKYTDKNINELVIPVGLGAKFRLSDGLNLDLGYTMNFVDADNFDGAWAGGKNDKYGYTHAGLEFVLGAKGKKQLAFHNPSAETYEQLAAAKTAAEEAKAAIAPLKQENANLKAELDKLKMDSDNDGVSDAFDKCPNTPAGTAVDGSGCPLPKAPAPVIQKIEKTIVTQQDRLVVADAIKNLEFDLGKATIRSTSFASLDRVAELLKSKGFSLNLAGHTDNTGNDASNQKLSEDRAAAVKDYLISKGVDMSKVTSEGYGESRPIASNKTAAGRQKNRRVEFTLAN